MSSGFDFPKSSRLLNAGDYSAVFDDVNLRVSTKHFLLLCHQTNKPNARLGIIVAKKNIKLAVQRNRIKRLLRESFRSKRGFLPKLDIVVLTKKGLSDLENELVNEELQYLWRKLVKKSKVLSTN